MDRRIIWVSVSCALVALVSCSGVASDNESGLGGGGFGGSGLAGVDSGGIEAIAGSAGADPEHAPDAGAAGSAGSLSSAGSAGDAGSGGVIARCSFSTVPAAPSPVDPSAPLEMAAEAAALADLDNLVGRYLRGDVLAYRGTASAHDNAGVIGDAAQNPAISDQTIAEGPVLGRLEFRPVSPYDYSPPKQNVSGDVAILVLSNALAQQHVAFSQALANPSLTEATQITDDSLSRMGLVTACTSCAPKFWSQPKAIVLDNLTTTGEFSVVPPSGPAVDVTLHTVVSARLALAPPCSLTYDDLVVLNGRVGPVQSYGDIAAFHLEHGQMVAHFADKQEPPHSLYDGCWYAQPYTLDVFIDPSDLSHYGVRNFKLGTPVRECIAV